MSVKVPVVLDNKIALYVKTRREGDQGKPLGELVADLLREWYEARLEEFYRQYLAGDLTLRGMARRLGLEYRELYDLLEARKMTV
jgi:hypothetical protein